MAILGGKMSVGELEFGYGVFLIHRADAIVVDDEGFRVVLAFLGVVECGFVEVAFVDWLLTELFRSAWLTLTGIGAGGVGASYQADGTDLTTWTSLVLYVSWLRCWRLWLF